MATPQQLLMASDISWARTPNRTERTAPAHKASPASLEYWVAKTREEGVVREEDIEKAAASAYRAHMRRVSMGGVAARARKKAEREQLLLLRSA